MREPKTELEFVTPLIHSAGSLVKMTSAHRRSLRNGGSREHASEFGGSAGVVVGLVDYGDGVRGPELDVRWLPGGLRYAYAPWALEPSQKKIRGARNKKKLADLRRKLFKDARKTQDGRRTP